MYLFISKKSQLSVEGRSEQNDFGFARESRTVDDGSSQCCRNELPSPHVLLLGSEHGLNLRLFRYLKKKICFLKIRSYFTWRRRKKRLQGLVGISEPWPCNPVDAIQFRDFLLFFFFLTKWCESIEREPSGGRWIMMGGGDAEPWLHNEFFFRDSLTPLTRCAIKMNC